MMNDEHNRHRSVPPDFLTLEEAAAVLRLGRNAAYDQAHLYEATGGAEGIPVCRYGKLYRGPRCKLEDALGGPITWPLPAADIAPAANDTPSPVRASTRPRSRRSSRPGSDPHPFSA
jgi:hypothetical protein